MANEDQHLSQIDNMPSVMRLGRPKLPRIRWQGEATCQKCASVYKITQRDLCPVCSSLYATCPVCNDPQSIEYLLVDVTDAEKQKMIKYATVRDAQRRIKRYKKRNRILPE